MNDFGFATPMQRKLQLQRKYSLLGTDRENIQVKGASFNEMLDLMSRYDAVAASMITCVQAMGDAPPGAKEQREHMTLWQERLNESINAMAAIFTKSVG